MYIIHSIIDLFLLSLLSYYKTEMVLYAIDTLSSLTHLLVFVEIYLIKFQLLAIK